MQSGAEASLFLVTVDLTDWAFSAQTTHLEMVGPSLICIVQSIFSGGECNRPVAVTSDDFFIELRNPGRNRLLKIFVEFEKILAHASALSSPYPLSSSLDRCRFPIATCGEGKSYSLVSNELLRDFGHTSV